MKVSTLLFVCALALSSIAAYYSIVGLAAIFSAAFWPVVIMAAILEVSKLVCASWLYQKWHIANKFIKTYLTVSVLILMLVTSLGIFGFLSRAHVDQQLTTKEASLQIEKIDSEIALIRETIDRYKAQLAQLDRSINIQLDANRASQAMDARRRQVAERDQIRVTLDNEQNKITQLESNKIQLRQNLSMLESKVGPIKYVAEFFVHESNVDLDKAVRWMILLLVIVFDPLAVLMLIAANMSYMNENNQFGSTIPSQMLDDHIAGSIKLKYDLNSKTLMYYNGTNWIETDLSLTNSNTIDKDYIRTAIQESLAQVVDNKSQIDYQNLQTAVRNAMDLWLTTASVTQQSNVDDQSQVSTNSSTDEVQESKPAPEQSDVAKTESEQKIIQKPISWI